MRQIEVVTAFADHQAGDHVEVDDQVAADAVAAGLAVPSIKAIDAAPENKAFTGAPETA